jgi:hypothetical protein
VAESRAGLGFLVGNVKHTDGSLVQLMELLMEVVLTAVNLGFGHHFHSSLQSG